MSRRLWISAVLLIVGAIHLLPAWGVLGASALKQLYGVQLQEPNLLLLMRHRALFFGLLAALLLGAAFRPVWQGLALAAAWVSVLGFVVLAPPDLSPSLQRVWWIDVAVLPLLALASWAYLSERQATRRLGAQVT
jgi:cytosine/uracil/thiamine/allantoin permease